MGVGVLVYVRMRCFVGACASPAGVDCDSMISMAIPALPGLCGGDNTGSSWAGQGRAGQVEREGSRSPQGCVRISSASISSSSTRIDGILKVATMSSAASSGV